MKSIFKPAIIFSLALNIVLLIIFCPKNSFAQEKGNYWEIQSIDTMKYSRDLARERSGDVIFERIIESYLEKIASTGVTHVAVGTPYDEEFISFMEYWVSAARKNNLNVWFRGNLSGWEGWFDYPVISKEEHTKNIGDFILNYPYLFEDGDIFTSCTECENGVLGDPRQTGDVTGYRKFLVDEYEVSKKTFEQIGKKVKTGYFSMNADVARVIMDEETTRLLGGVVVIDHYVEDPSGLAQDVKEISEISKGKIVLGEFGVPIPDIHGVMDSASQAEWITDALNHLSKESSLAGINYWVSFGGTTAIWNNDGSEKPAVAVLRSYFLPNIIFGEVFNEIGEPVENALIIADSKQSYTDEKGKFNIASNPSLERIVINASSYKDKIYTFEQNKSLDNIFLEKEKEGLIFKFRKFVHKTVIRIRNR
jgi:hypothetical protein